MTDAGQGWFAASEAVGRYWLARCDGFEVCSEDGRLTGVVAGVDLDSAGRPSTLLVERHKGRPLQIEPGSVTWVDPWQQLVVVTLPPRKPRTARARAVTRAASRGGHAARTGAATVGAASLSAAATARRAAPQSGRFAARLGARAAYALAFLGWLYGAVLFTVSRAVAWVLLMLVRGASRVGSWIIPPLARSAQKAIRRVLRHLAADAPRPRPERSQARVSSGRSVRKARRGSLHW